LSAQPKRISSLSKEAQGCQTRMAGGPLARLRGVIARAHLRVHLGDRLGLNRRGPASIGATGTSSLAQRRADRAARAGAGSPAPAHTGRAATAGAVTRIRPLSVLVISPDRRFRSVTSVLIARRGCAVATTETASRLVELADRIAADVVVIDADGGSRSAARARAQVSEYGRPLGLVLVDEEPIAARDGDPGPLAKWGPFERLYAAIEAADTWRVKPVAGRGG
jgi:hypothetical protein